MGQLLFRTLVGLVAGVAVWAILEPMAPINVHDPAWVTWEGWFFLLMGSVIGGSVGALNGYLRGGKVHTLRGLGLGVLLGAIGGTLGHTVGSTLMRVVTGGMDITAVGEPMQTMGRVAAIGPAATLIGLAIGGASLSTKSLRNGALGGAIAGVIAGLVFDPLGAILAPMIMTLHGTQPGQVAETGAPSRAVTAALIGGMVALFIGIVERLARSAWLQLKLGRNEGKEWVVDMPQTFIGRSEKAHVPIFGDPSIAPMHACIMRHGPGYVLMDSGAGGGTRLNGHPIQQAPLNSGDMITLGTTTLEFVTRSGAAPVRGPEQYIGQAYPLQGGNAATPVVPVAVSPYMAPQQQPLQMPTGMPVPASTSSGGYTLVAMDGPLAGKRYPVTGQVDLGRESTLIPLAFDNMASRRHAHLEPGSMGLTVTDLNSTNGTFVNGQRVNTQSVNPGDMLRVGATTFRVEGA
jgi:pSer/pThr/pTyr-binding forkhead associated (FHA) protein